MRMLVLRGKSWIECRFESIRISLAQAQFGKVMNRRQDNLWRKRERCHNSPWRQCTVIGAVWRASGYVVKKLSRNSLHLYLCGTRSLARRQSPGDLAIALEFQWVLDCVRLLDERRAAAILKVVAALLTHEVVLNAPKVYPGM